MSTLAMAGPALAIEQELILLCARTRLNDLARKRIDYLLGQSVDWDFAISLAWGHHTIPLLYYHLSHSGLERLPTTAQNDLRARYHFLVARNLKLTNESYSILNALENAAVPGVVWKGPALAHIVYPSPELRTFNDLDILIRRQDVTAALNRLEALGYSETSGNDVSVGDPSRKKGGDVTMEHPELLLRVDLHWGEIGRYFSSAMNVEALWTQHDWTRANGHRFRALSPEAMVIPLALHGAKHGPHPWPALKWVTDLEAMIYFLDDSTWTRILEHAGSLGCRRRLLLGIALAEELLGAVPPAPLRLTIRKEIDHQLLVRGIRDRLLFPEQADMTFAERLRFDLAVRERLRDRIVYRTSRLLTPGKRDKVPGKTVLRVPLRLARLGRKYLLQPGRGRDFLLGKKQSPGAPK